MADAISHLPTYGCVTPDPELAIATFLIENENETPRYSVTNKVDLSSWTKDNWYPYEFQDDKRIIQFSEYFLALAVETDAVVSVITLGEVRQAQEEYQECKIIRSNIQENRDTIFLVDERGLIVRIAEADGIYQIFVPRKLRHHILHLAHHTPLAGHPGITRQFYIMRSQWYWP